MNLQQNQFIAYDVEKLKNSEFQWDDSALKVLELKKGICQDYTYLALALLRASGMEEDMSRDSRIWLQLVTPRMG